MAQKIGPIQHGKRCLNMKHDQLTRKLEELRRLNMRLHRLKNTIPVGLKSIDDETDLKIKNLKEFIKEFRLKWRLERYQNDTKSI